MLKNFCRQYAWAIVSAALLAILIVYFLTSKSSRPLPPQVSQPPTATAQPTVAAPNKTPRFAIVIDDIGFNPELAAHYFAISPKITMAIIPSAPHATELAKLAHQKGHEILIHQPMEPMDRRQIETGSLELRMNDTELAAVLKEAVTAVPFAVGINNHTGSRMTADYAAMRRLMPLLKPYNLFILDSRTTAESKLAQAAEEAHIPHISRQVFLDNDKSPAHILYQLQQALHYADRHGKAVAIGHPYLETSTALREFFAQHPERLQQLRPLSELVFN